jgi:hypothetical protein
MSLRESPAGDAPARGGATTAGRGAAGAALGRLAGHPLAWPGLAGLALGLLAVGPGLAPGYILSYDMVFAPRMPVTAAALGLAGGPPRAVPSDAILAVLGAVVPADLAQKVILVFIFVTACAGAARLLGHCAARAGRGAPLAGRVAAGVLYAWNPYLAERLIIGHWALLLGYAALPWVVAAVAVAVRAGPSGGPALGRRSGHRYAVIGVRRKRRGHDRDRSSGKTAGSSVTIKDRRGRWGGAVWVGLLVALVPAAAGGFEAVGICALAAVPVALAGAGGGRARVRRLAVTVAALGVASLPWLIPAVVVAVRTDPDGAAAFAARPDTPFGGAVSLLMLGGIWNAQVVPRGYGGAGSAAWLLVVLVAVAGYVLLGARARACPGLGVAAVAGYAIAAAGLTGTGRAGLARLIAAWPGFAVLRDGQLYLAPLALAEAIGLGLVTAWVLSVAARMTMRPAETAGDAAGTESRIRPPGANGGWRDTGRAAGVRRAAGAGGVGQTAGSSGVRRAAGVLAVMAAVAPVVLLPGLAWGAAGRLRATEYPADWLAARRVMDSGPRGGAAVLLPWAAYRRFSWNGGEATLDPWTKLLRRPLIWNDALVVGRLTVAAEDPAARRLTPAMAGAGPLTGALRAAGARYVIVDAGPLMRGGGCLAGRARLPGATVVLASRDLVVFRLPAVAGNAGKGAACPAADR